MKAVQIAPAKASLSAPDAGTIMLSGVLDFYTVPELMKQAETVLAQTSAARVDLSAVTNTNSAGLTLLLEMWRFMQARNATIQFINIPEQIAIVARAYGIDSALDSPEFAQQAST